MALPVWLVVVGRFVARLVTRREAIGEAVKTAEQLVGEVEAVIYDDPPSQPLSHEDVEHIRRQVDSATSHKVPPTHVGRIVYTQTGPTPGVEACNRPPPGWWCSREPFHGGACAAYPLGEGPTERILEPLPGVAKAVPRGVDREAVTPAQGTPRIQKKAPPPRPKKRSPMKGEKNE